MPQPVPTSSFHRINATPDKETLTPAVHAGLRAIVSKRLREKVRKSITTDESQVSATQTPPQQQKMTFGQLVRSQQQNTPSPPQTVIEKDEEGYVDLSKTKRFTPTPIRKLTPAEMARQAIRQLPR